MAKIQVIIGGNSFGPEREEQKGNLAPTGHKVPEGRSPDDPNMEFTVPDCGVDKVWGSQLDFEGKAPFVHPIGKKED